MFNIQKEYHNHSLYKLVELKLWGMEVSYEKS